MNNSRNHPQVFLVGLAQGYRRLTNYSVFVTALCQLLPLHPKLLFCHY